MSRKNMSKGGEVLIGWAAVDITPPKPILLNGQFYARISERVNDPITAAALAIEAGEEQAVIVSCDTVSVPDDVIARCREQAKGMAAGLDTEKIFFSATHTHTSMTFQEGIYPEAGPDVMPPTECANLFIERAAGCIATAWEGRKEGGISWGFGQAVVGHNRRQAAFDGTARMYGKTDHKEFSHIEGYEDHGVDVLFTWDSKERLTGMLVNLACPSQVTEAEKYISADFWHETREELRKRHSADLFVLPQCAPAGDQSPHFLLYEKEESRMRELKGVSEREEISRRIADAVDRVLPVVRKDIRTELVFAHTVKTLSLPVRKVTDAELKDAKEKHARAAEEYERLRKEESETSFGVSRAFVSRRRNKAVVDRYERQEKEPYLPMQLHVLRLGDIAMATSRFELFLDFGLRMKARSKAAQTFLVQLAGNGTYLPTKRAMAAKGYGGEAVDSLVGPEGGQVIVEETVAEIGRVWQ